ncbi:MAG: protein kinase [Verrucomicrobiota bacterium]
MNPQICPTCHYPIPPNAPGGFCPACLLRDAEEPVPAGRAAPTVEEIAAAFPQLEILELIGQGGMGFVYQARQPNLDRIVALKILSPELGRDPAFAERFAREARVLGRLHHPNIVTVFEHGESGGFFYLLMEYVDGVNLRQAMRAGRFTPDQALAIVPGICDALQFAHEQGVWHRDIKPENILLDARGQVKMADFGIARIVGDPQRDFTLTLTGNALGSAAYMAPEQHENPRDVDHRADIYSLGVVIYEMLTGELPLGRFPAPSQRAAVNARIDEIVFRTLEKERELRQQSATEVKTDVQGAATATARKDDAAEGKSPLSKLPRLVLWSLGLLIGGAALAPLGFYMMDKFRGSGGGTSGAFALVVGGLALVLGLIGSLWRLYEIRRGWVPPTGRWLLIAIAIPILVLAEFGLSVFGVSTLESIGLSSPYLVSFLPDKGSVLIQQAFVLGYLSLALASVFYLVRPLSPVTRLRRDLETVCLVLAACATIGSAALAKRLDYHWPQVFFRNAASLALVNPGRLPNDQVRDLLKEAAGPFADDYQLVVREHGAGVREVAKHEARDTSSPHTEVSVVAMTRKPAILSSGGEQFLHAKACLYRLRDMLPADTIHLSAVYSGHFRGNLTIALPVLAGLAALLAALAGGRRAVWIVAGGVALHLVLVALPVWRTPEDLKPPRLLDAPPLSLTVAPELLTQPDFSTPEKAVMSVYDAACFGRIDVVKRGLSKTAVALLDRKNGWAEFMDVYSGLRVIASLERMTSNGNSAIIDGLVINRSGRNAGSRYQMEVVREEGEWRVASLHGLKSMGGPFGETHVQTTTIVRPEKTRWQVHNTDTNGQPAESFELHGKLGAETTSGGNYKAATVHVGGQPLFMIVGEGYMGGSFTWQSIGNDSRGNLGDISFSLTDENKAIIENRTYDLTRGRVFFVRPDGSLRQIAARPDRVLSGDGLKNFVAGLPPEGKPEAAVPARTAEPEDRNAWRKNLPQEVREKLSGNDLNDLLRGLGYVEPHQLKEGGKPAKIDVWGNDFSNFDNDETKDWVIQVNSVDFRGMKISGILIYDLTEHGWTCMAKLPGTFPVGWNHEFEGRKGFYTQESIPGEPPINQRQRYFRWDGNRYVEDRVEYARGG